MLLNDIAKLNILEIEEKIVATEGEERLFYVSLYNKILEIRRKETLHREIQNKFTKEEMKKLVSIAKESNTYSENGNGL